MLVELEPRIDPAVNARAIAIADRLRDRQLPGVRDVVATYRSVAVYFDPLTTDLARLRAAVDEATDTPTQAAQGRTIEVPVVYGGEYGPDLDEVAALAGLTPEEVVSRHAGRSYRVFMIGFLPGFPYMGPVDARIAAGRRATPRVRVPAGSVGIAGRQTGIYPQESPGGWRIIGRTPLRLFDPRQVPPSMLMPGDTVRFTAIAPGGLPSGPMGFAEERDGLSMMGEGTGTAGLAGKLSGRWMTVVRPGLFTTVQDEGRWGFQSSGTPVGGALDWVSHRVANALVGNSRDAATLEVTLAGPELRFEAPARIAVVGADLEPTLDGAPVPRGRAVACRAGASLRFGGRRSGARAYVAIAGGIDLPPVLGSRSTHVRTGMGGLNGRPLAAGDRLPLGPPREGRTRPIERRLEIRGGARLRVLPGPQLECFPDDALARLQQCRYRVSGESDRMGYRLLGPPIPNLDRGMISDATFTGALQVPPSGQPILLMADRQTTGGYPQLAIVIRADLPKAAQLAPGDWVEFEVCSRADALAALIAQEGEILAIG